MRMLPPDDQVIVERAQALGLIGDKHTPAYLSPDLCTVLSIILALPTLGYSLILLPLLWVVQHDRTAHRLGRLRHQLETFPG